jgi:hypothetical protein
MADLERRYTDHIKSASDHDLLIKINTKVSFICKELAETKETLKDHIETISDTCTRRKELCEATLDKKVLGSVFWKLVTILVVVFGVLFTTSITNRVDVSRNTTVIKYNSAQLIENIEVLKRMERILP